MEIFMKFILSVFILSFVFTSNSFAKLKKGSKKGVYLTYNKKGDNRGCHDKIPKYNRVKDACRDPKYFGQRIYECWDVCKKKKFLKCVKTELVIKTGRLCSNDKKRKGIYVGSCAGERVKLKNFNKACAIKKHKGLTLVRCRNGEEVKRKTCSATVNNDATKKQTRIFIKSCGAEVVTKVKNNKEVRRNFKKACKNKKYQGEVLVKCSSRCTKRKGLKCIRRTWIEKGRVVCNENKKIIELNTCNEQQGHDLSKAIALAKLRLTNVINSMNTFLANPDQFYLTYARLASFDQEDLELKDKAVGRVTRAVAIAAQVKNKLQNIGSKYYCSGNYSGRCSLGGANAHTTYLENSNIYFCNGFLELDTSVRKAAVLVHELSHNYKAQDLEYTRSKIKDVEWDNNAETYEMWIEKNRLCIPGYDC
jgi:hypothetical protein